MTAPEAIVRLPTLPVFSDIHAMLSGWVYGQDCTTHAAKYLVRREGGEWERKGTGTKRRHALYTAACP